MCKLRAENQYDVLIGLFDIAGLFTVALDTKAVAHRVRYCSQKIIF